MAFDLKQTIKALATKSPRGLGWTDVRDRSPKDLHDWSGVLLSRVTSGSSVGVQDFDYELMSQIYICNDLVWACINLVSSTAALAKLKVRKNGEFVPDHPLQKMLDYPNSSMTLFDLIQSYVTHQMLFGNVTMLLLRSDMEPVCDVCKREDKECVHKLWNDTESPVLQVMPVHPNNIEKVFDKSTNTNWFYYVPGDGNKYPIHPNNMISDPYYNPDVSWYGVSPTHTLRRWLKLDDSMTRQLNQYFQNGSIPSMILNIKPPAGGYTEESSTLVQKVKEGWLNQFSARSATAKTPAVVFGDIDIHKVQENVNDTIGKDLYYEIQNRVCAVYGVPPTLFEMGIKYGGQRASAAQGEKDFYNRTISKILLRLKEKFSHLIVPSYGEDIELVWDLSDMGLASFITAEKDERITKHWQLGLIQRNKAQILLGYDPDTSELGNDYYRLTVMGDGSSTVSNQLDNNLRVPESNEQD